MLVGEAAAGVDAELGERLLDLFVGDAERAQRRRMRRDAVLADLAADRDHLGDARNGQQPRPDDEVGGLAQLHRRGALAGHRDQQDLAHDRADRPHLRQRCWAAADRGPARAVRRSAGGCDRCRCPSRTRHRRSTGRCRRPSARALTPGTPFIWVSIGKVTSCSTSGGREALRLGHDGDGRLVEVGKDVDRQPRDREYAP